MPDKMTGQDAGQAGFRDIEFWRDAGRSGMSGWGKQKGLDS